MFSSTYYIVCGVIAGIVSLGPIAVHLTLEIIDYLVFHIGGKHE